MKEYQKPFIGYVEDDPMYWTSRHATEGKARTWVRNLVARRFIKNGAGEGVVLHEEDDYFMYHTEGGKLTPSSPILIDLDLPPKGSERAKEMADFVRTRA